MVAWRLLSWRQTAEEGRRFDAFLIGILERARKRWSRRGDKISGCLSQNFVIEKVCFDWTKSSSLDRKLDSSFNTNKCVKRARCSKSKCSKPRLGKVLTD